jgi:hypothetical protein
VAIVYWLYIKNKKNYITPTKNPIHQIPQPHFSTHTNKK